MKTPITAIFLTLVAMSMAAIIPADIEAAIQAVSESYPIVASLLIPFPSAICSQTRLTATSNVPMAMQIIASSMDATVVVIRLAPRPSQVTEESQYTCALLECAGLGNKGLQLSR